MSNYFKRPGDLTVEGTEYFKRPGDLTVEGTEYFKRPGDLPTENHQNEAMLPLQNINKERSTGTAMTEQQIKDYLLTIATGKKYGFESELGTLSGGGRTITTFEELNEMVATGYNIVSANYIGNNMIEVEFQQFRKNNETKRRR
jgi:hypothetical protein